MRTRFARLLYVVALGVALGVAMSQSGARLAAQESFTGTLSAVIGDPVGSGTPVEAYFLHTAEGAVALEFEPGRAPSPSDLMALSGRTITVAGSRTATSRDLPAAIHVTSIDALQRGEPLVAPRVSGPQPIATLQCRFSDSLTVTRTFNQSLLTGSAFPSIDYYYREASYGAITLAGSQVFPWVNLPQPKSYYVLADGRMNWAAATADCTAASDAFVDFTQFVGFNMLFNEGMPYLWGGSWTITLDGVNRTWRTTWVGLPSNNYFFLLAGMAHENGHGFGFPHSRSDGWDVMAGPAYYYDRTLQMYVPQHPIAYHKNLAEWIPADKRFAARRGSTTTIRLSALASPAPAGAYLSATIPITGSSTHYYAVEFRTRVGHDSWIPGTGVLIHDVLTTRGDQPAQIIDADGNNNLNDAGAMWTAGETYTDAQAGVTIAVNATTGTTATVTITLAGKSDLLLPFGPTYGLWRLDLGTSWSQVHPISPEAVVAADLDGDGADEIVADFGPTYGVFARAGVAPNAWSQLTTDSPTLLTVADLDGNGMDDLVGSFGAGGVRTRINNAAWTSLHPLAVTHMAVGDLDADGRDDVVLDFPGFGLWVRQNNASWFQLHPLNAREIVSGDFDGNGRADVAIDFGSAYGIWSYWNNQAWTQVHAQSGQHLATGNVDSNAASELVIDFGADFGIWMWRNGTTWTKVHDLTSEGIVLADLNGSGRADIVVDFGPTYGFWIMIDDSAWLQGHTLSPEFMQPCCMH